MAARTSEAEWKGSLREGKGTMKLEAALTKGPIPLRPGLRAARAQIPRS